eukprot:758322-Hanusia_phi.AAC.3
MECTKQRTDRDMKEGTGRVKEVDRSLMWRMIIAISWRHDKPHGNGTKTVHCFETPSTLMLLLLLLLLLPLLVLAPALLLHSGLATDKMYLFSLQTAMSTLASG